MESDIQEILKTFSPSSLEKKGVELGEEDVCIRLEEAGRSLIGKVFGEKRSDFMGVKSAMMKF